MMTRSLLVSLLLLCGGLLSTSQGASLNPDRWIPADVGAPALPGSTRVEGERIEVIAGGTGLGPRLDQFHFAASETTNDFDLKIRVSALEATDVLARAGLMVRANLDSNAPFAGVFASPSAAGTHFLYRTSPGSIPVQAGLFPPNLPYAWLRLQRTGDLLAGMASVDGRRWTLLGSTVLSLPESQVGIAVTSHNANQTTRAVFEDLADAGPADLSTPLATVLEPPGPSSRRSAVVISEVMYHPGDRIDGRNGEFVEIYNSQPFVENISGWKLSGDYEFTFPPDTQIPGGGFLLVAPSPGDVRFIHGISNVLGGFTNTLSNGSGTVRLLSDRDAVFFDLTYRDKPPWPLAADGAGHSLALLRPSYGEDDPRAWGSSSRPGGSPGSWEGLDASPRRTLRINEVLLRGTTGGAEPFIEVFNPSALPLDLDGCRLGYATPAVPYLFPAGTRLDAGGHLAVPASQLGFSLRQDAESLFLREPAEAQNGGAVIDAVRFEPAGAGISRGRSPDGSDEVYALESPTPGSVNRSERAATVVINELFHSPLSGDDDLQFVELFNPGAFAVSVAGWRLEDGIQFVFPATAVIPSGGHLVVARDARRLRAAHPGLTRDNCLGDFNGRLSGRGERLVLERPEIVPAMDGAPARTVFVPVDEVTYRTGGQWGFWSDGGGSSLELVDPRADRRFGANWADSNESARARWTTIEATGVLEYIGGVADSLHVGLMGEGECLLDNLEVIGPDGTNLITNGTFEGATTNFTVLGNHIRSTFEKDEGDSSARSLHIRASGNMDTGANRIRFRLTKTIPDGEKATLRARVRWLKGWPEPLLRLHGNALEATGRLDFPEVGGTPGTPNTRRVANAGPAITGVTHTPVLPALNEPVRIAIRARDPDGIGSVTLNWRLDPSGDVIPTPMRDDGTDGDERAGDGVFSATVPGQPTPSLISFTIAATDAASAPASAVFPATGPGQECLVRFGEPILANSFGTYRLWIARSNVTRWSSRPNLSNEPIPGTLVYGNFRAIHGAGYRFAGSPYHQQFSSPSSDCHYVWRLPGDDRLLGSDNFNKVHAPGNGPFDDDTTQREQTVYWMARQMGLPWLYRRFVNVYVNGSKRRKLMEDTQVPGGDFVSSYYPQDDQGDLYKINPWFEFESGTGTSIGFNNVAWADLNDYRGSDGQRKMSRYRWNWQPRAANGTVNNYTNFFALLDAASSPTDEDFIRAMESQADIGQWLRVFALNHAVGNWDSFGNRNAQNMYTYKPQQGRWQLFMWDANIVLGNSGSDGPSGDDLFQYNFSDGPMGRLYAIPQFRRAYLRALKEVADGPMLPGPVGALIDSKYAAFQAAGVSAASGSAVKSWIRSRVTYLRSEVAKVSANFTIRAEGVTGGSTPQNLVTLTGTAPISVATLTVNGIETRVVWTGVTEWTATVILQPGDNRLSIVGRDALGRTVPGTTRQLNIRFTGTAENPAEKLVFSEIHYRPLQPGAGFVELLNTSTGNAFDLSGWSVEGLDYTFRASSILQPGSRWVIAANAGVFARTYDPARASQQGVFSGTLSPDGETLRLIRPSPAPAPGDVITSVTYSPEAPWPALAAGEGSSLQLIDPSRSEDERAGNWTAVAPRDPNSVEWKRATATGTAGADGTLQLYLSSYPPVTDPLAAEGIYFGSIRFGDPPFPCGVRLDRVAGNLTAGFLFDRTNPDNANPLVGVSQNGPDLRFGFDAQNRFTGKLSDDGSQITGVYIGEGTRTPFTFDRINPGGEVLLDDLALVAGANAESGPNLIANGSFESGLAGTWTANGAHAASERILNRAHTGTAALRVVSSAGGTGTANNALVQAIPGLAPGTLVTLSFWYLESTNGSGLVARLGDGTVQAAAPLAPSKDPHHEYSPGYDSTATAPLAAFPDLWLNEVLPDPADGEPFAELFNHGTNTIRLDGFFLSDRPTQPLLDAFPAGLSLSPGQFLRIILDGSGLLADPGGPRTSFRPSARDGLLLLTRVQEGQTNLMDFVRWAHPGRGRSVGHYPDASPHGDREFATPTPAAPNSLAAPLLPVLINEWLALNTVLADPAGGPDGGEFDDWFELFNPNPTSFDLAGFVLSNALSDRTKFRVPAGYVVPPRGFLLVWADNQSRQNSPDRADLHVNFKLSGGGESIALFTPDGALMDAVTFGPQQSNVSEGRPTDGGEGPFQRFPVPTGGAPNAARPDPEPPLVSPPILHQDGTLELRWTTEPGRIYQVQWKNALSDPWQNLGEPLTAAGSSLSATDARSDIATRYYQVVVSE